MDKEMCRFCLNNEKLVPIFTDTQKLIEKSEELALITGLVVLVGDELPQQICEDCTELVNAALKLRKQSQDALLQLLQLGYSSKTRTKTRKDKSILQKKRKETVIEENVIPEIQIEVEFNRITDLKNEKEDKQERNFNITDTDSHEFNEFDTEDSETQIEQPDVKVETTGNKHSRKTRRAAYLNLVEGVLDPKGPVKCKVCKKTLSRWATFVSHAKIHLGFKFVCEYCGKSFISSTQLTRHCRSHHGMERELKCPHCDFLALDKAQLVLHERRLHSGERPFACALCRACYHSRRCLLQHLESHRSVATVQCDKCPQMFKSRRHLARHTYTAHTSKQFTYKCPACDRVYSNLKYIRVHLKKQHGLTTKQANIIKIKL